MRWQFWRGKGPQELSVEVQKALVSRFHVDPGDLLNLQCLEMEGWFTDRPVKFLRIFNATLAAGNGAAIVRSYHDLDTHQELILFVGRVEKNGTVHLLDRRPPKVVVKSRTRPHPPARLP